MPKTNPPLVVFGANPRKGKRVKRNPEGVLFGSRVIQVEFRGALVTNVFGARAKERGRDTVVTFSARDGVVMIGEPDGSVLLEPEGVLGRAHSDIDSRMIGRIISSHVRAVAYVHADDGDQYRHVFHAGTVMTISGAGYVIRRIDGLRSWEDM